MNNTGSERQTRQELIDEQLACAGWGLNERTLLEESRIGIAENNGEYLSKPGIADYVLLGRDGKPLAIVEAKRSSRDELSGKKQAENYALQVKRQFGIEPFIFLANGQNIQFWDRGRYPPRAVSGFFSREDLERLNHQKRYALPLGQVEINAEIAGRAYQLEGVRRITEAVQAARRQFLLVMATGTGKTRTVISLLDLLLRAKRVQRVLFLADRRELVRQAMGDLKRYLSNESLGRIEGGRIPQSARIQVATYPSAIHACQKLSPGYYDLIVADESHRSIYNCYKVIFEYFDAMHLGLTATPTDYIDHNTFQLFGCEDGAPTFNYSYGQAKDEGYLVNYRVLQTQTNFQIAGIQGGNLPDALQQQLAEQGIELEELNFEGTDIEKRVTNTGTNDTLVREFMEKSRKDALGLPAKSIIFTFSHAHAKRIYESFNRLYPDYQRRGLAEIIDSHMERAEQMLDEFKNKDMPRIAISVDMLDTGIDVPAIQTLMFAKPVFSRVKFWQMIGRGTRLYTNPRTDETKQNFLIIDCWNNFDYFRLNPDGETERPGEPLPVSLFRLRLEKNTLDRDDGATVASLQAMLAQLPLDNINVRPHREEITRLMQAWPKTDEADNQYLGQTIAPLLRYYWAASLSEIQFRVQVERAAVAHLQGNKQQVAGRAEKIRESISALADSIQEVRAVAEQRAWVLSEGFWEHPDMARLQQLQDTFAPLMRFRQTQSGEMVQLQLPDRIAERRWIIYGPAGEGAFADSYREQVEAYVRGLADSQPALNKLQRGEAVDEDEIQDLAETLNQADLFITEELLREIYRQPAASLPDFMRHILNIARLPDREEQIKTTFDQFIQEHGFMSAGQINFLRAIRAAVLRHAKITRAQLDQPPLSRLGVVETLFKPEEIKEIIRFANELATA